MTGDQRYGQSDHPYPAGDDLRPIVNPRSPREAIMPEPVPPPPSSRARHPLVVVGNAIFTLLVLLILAGGVTFYYGVQKYNAPGPLDRERAVTIPRGHSIREIAELLRREGVIEQPLVFIGIATALGSTRELKAGEYLFDRQASIRDVLDILSEGKAIQYQVTIPEGLTSEQIVQKLREVELLTGDITTIPPEGTLLPETYKVTRGTTREQILARMAAAHRRLLSELWERRAPDLPLKSPEELVILASIVEKETGKADERTRVAAVFVNRLARKMRLQSDPTVIYGIVGGKGVLGRPLQRDDLERPTPYNTYTSDGLPPGPIANPGRASLEAVANPSRTKELYFVADGTGGHVFAETLDQHNRNVVRWRNFLKEQAAAEAKAAQPIVVEEAKDASDSGAKSNASSGGSRANARGTGGPAGADGDGKSKSKTSGKSGPVRPAQTNQSDERRTQ